MKINGAIIKEQGVNFAIVVVKRHVIQNRFQAQDAIRGYSAIFPRMPVILMAQDYRGTPTYYGRRDIVNFLSKVPVQAIPWREYTIN